MQSEEHYKTLKAYYKQFNKNELIDKVVSFRKMNDELTDKCSEFYEAIKSQGVYMTFYEEMFKFYREKLEELWSEWWWKQKQNNKS